jgi:hypothetical protein
MLVFSTDKESILDEQCGENSCEILILVNFNTDTAKVAAAFLMPSHRGKYTSLYVFQPTTVGKLGLFPSLVDR